MKVFKRGPTANMGKTNHLHCNGFWTGLFSQVERQKENPGEKVTHKPKEEGDLICTALSSLQPKTFPGTELIVISTRFALAERSRMKNTHSPPT